MVMMFVSLFLFYAGLYTVIVDSGFVVSLVVTLYGGICVVLMI